MITLERQNSIYLNVGRYFLAILFVFKAIDCFVHPFYSHSGEMIGLHFYLVLLQGCAWSVAALSFIANIWTRVTGLVIAGVAIVLIFTTEIFRLIHFATFDSALLSIAFYFATIGGVIIVASHNMERQEHAVSHSFSLSLATAGRLLVGLFYFIAGYLHMMNVSSDARMIADVPYANFWVIFVGVCWLATAFSIWSNILTSLSTFLAIVMVIIITLTINIHAFTQGNTLNALIEVAGNVGIIGATLVAGSESTYALLNRLRM